MTCTGDLISPIINVGFFITGVVIVVKVLLYLVTLIKAKFFVVKKVVIKDRTDDLNRGRRAAPDGHHPDQLDGLTSVVMAALESQQCLQRMMCELGTYIHQYDQANLIAGYLYIPFLDLLPSMT